MSALTLRWQGESQNADPQGRHYGYEVFSDAEGVHQMRTHIRSYDGVRVDSSWSSDLVALEATNLDSAVEEAREKFRTWVRALQGLPVSA